MIKTYDVFPNPSDGTVTVGRVGNNNLVEVLCTIPTGPNQTLTDATMIGVAIADFWNA